MRRLNLSTKLLAAALPLILAVGALLVFTVRTDLDEISRAERGARLGTVWGPLISVLDAVEIEVGTVNGELPDGMDAPEPDAARQATDRAIDELRDTVEAVDSDVAALGHITATRSALSAARRSIDGAEAAPAVPNEADPLIAYERAAREVVAIGQLLPAEAGDQELGRQLLAVVKLADARLSANRVVVNATAWQAAPTDRAPLLQARAAFTDLESALSEFLAVAPDQWADEYRQSGFATALAGYRSDLAQAVLSSADGEAASFDVAGFDDLVDQAIGFQRMISDSIVEQATAQADETRQATFVRIGIILGAVLLAGLVTVLIIRSVTRRVRRVAIGANRVADEQLPALVGALRDERGNASLPAIEQLPSRGSDEIAELARSFNSVQTALMDVANQQVEVLRRGVSDIFVTMARRNRSLIDRQLAMLDEYEAAVEDPDTLANYYQLDHLATRMRRNSESLLVLADAEPKRSRVKETEIDDVVRASISEVEDYKRIRIEALDPLQVRGNVVADVSHLLAELLDNATSFSPPATPVRVGGRRAGDSYLIRIVDDGVGMGEDRLDEMNRLLQEPPVIGLSASTTLGMSVVSLLAAKHGITVTLGNASPGVAVDVALPATLFGPNERQPVLDPTGAAAAYYDLGGDRPNYDILKTDADPDPAPPGPPAPVAGAPSTAPAPSHAPDDEPRVVSSDLSSLSSNLSAFTSGISAARSAPDADAEPTSPPPPPPAPTGFAPDRPSPPDVVNTGQVHTSRANAVRAEFDVPPAPPVSAAGPSSQPVTAPDARPAPPIGPMASADGLPTRDPGSQPAVDGPDRLADHPDEGRPAASEPGALGAALDAFTSSQRSGRGDSVAGARGPAPMNRPDDAGARSLQLDPDALRERLRSLQSDFPNDPPTDLGGDPR